MLLRREPCWSWGWDSITPVLEACESADAPEIVRRGGTTAAATLALRRTGFKPCSGSAWLLLPITWLKASSSDNGWSGDGDGDADPRDAKVDPGDRDRSLNTFSKCCRVGLCVGLSVAADTLSRLEWPSAGDTENRVVWLGNMLKLPPRRCPFSALSAAASDSMKRPSLLLPGLFMLSVCPCGEVPRLPLGELPDWVLRRAEVGVSPGLWRALPSGGVGGGEPPAMLGRRSVAGGLRPAECGCKFGSHGQMLPFQSWGGGSWMRAADTCWE